ncbi:XRE family transcriptional regulator [Pseudomonas guariconensis]|uniref:XRE family transcriptional regulator n=1 Tax=Pseudomonas guariconensis TaxID=1288410 RepID=A0AAX0VQR5_9PSED|nr:helix-turn-helix transcriptional regulator [Pseudomonas guariconensis]PLV12855.1 XRE family transcriptional regulator [Pseudomonas guariconensis]PLV20926.1 XRE family transcriptional regulator [Pseudomonas guariconensis]PLV26555.1 XRE family transcriptional regulator [Pseudomonas guariconensis]
MSTLGQRIARKREQAGLNQSELARRLSVTPQAVQKWESEVSVPRGKRLDDIAAALGTSVAYLVTGEFLARSDPAESNATVLGPIDVWDDDTPLDDDEVYVPFLKEVELSAGSGRTVVEQSHKQKLRFGKLTLRKQGVQPDNAVCVTVSGNSMEPVLPDKSTVGVDQGCTGVTDGKMYAIDHDGQLRVKILYRMPGGGIRMRSFNRDEHPDEEYSAQEMIDQNIQIKGKVFWSSVLW